MAAVVALSEKVLSAKSIICDIEGTTTSISFVKDTLFPYALKNVEEYLKENWNEEATKTVVAALREQAEEDKKAELEGVVAIPAGDSEDIIPDIVKNVEWQMSLDRKTGSLKTLQGLVWAKGYKDGTIKGHVYDDVQKAFEQWTENGRKIFIYSSGSVDAQKLLFEHSEQGDLLKYLSGHYDTKIGAKREKDSYTAILKNIESSAEEALFLTDVYAEAKAAKDAGLNVVLLDRPGNAELSEEERKDFPVIGTFSDLSFAETKEENGAATNGKRKIEETNDVAEEDQAQEQPPSKLVKVEENGKTEPAEASNDKDVVKSSESPAESASSLPENAETMEVDGEVAKKTDEEKGVEKMEEDTEKVVDDAKKTTEEKTVEVMDTDKHEEDIEIKKPNEEKSVSVEEQKETIEDKNEKAEQTVQETEKKEEEVEKKKEEVEKKEKEVEKKEEVVEKKEEEVEKKEEEVEKKEEVAEKKEEVAEKKEVVAEKKDEVAEKKDEVAEKKDEVAEKKEDVKKLETIANKEDKNTENADVVVEKEDPSGKDEIANEKVETAKEKEVKSVENDDKPMEEEKKEEEMRTEKDNSNSTSDENDSKKKEEETKEVEITDGIETKSDAAVDEVAAEAKEEEKVQEDTKPSAETEKTNGDDKASVDAVEQETKSPKEGDGSAESKSTELNGAVPDTNVSTNGSSAGDEEKNGDSDKENDTSVSNCEAEESPVEKTNGTTAAESATGEDVSTSEVKAKKVIETATPAVTPAPPIEAES